MDGIILALLGSRRGRAADASACAASSCRSAHFTGGPWRSWGGGGSSARVAQLALVRVGRVLGVVRWSGGRGMGGNFGGIGDGPPALGHWRAIGGGTRQSTRGGRGGGGDNKEKVMGLGG